MSKAIEGGCLCGAVRYQLQAKPTHLVDCHCLDCRRASGAPFVTWGTVQKSDLVIVSGEVRDVEYLGRVRSFAGCCGTTLFFADNRGAAAIDIAIASLDQPEPFVPERAIWVEDKLPWVVVDPARVTYKQGGGSEQVSFS
jgi:hypothetical protein